MKYASDNTYPIFQTNLPGWGGARCLCWQQWVSLSPSEAISFLTRQKLPFSVKYRFIWSNWDNDLVFSNDNILWESVPPHPNSHFNLFHLLEQSRISPPLHHSLLISQRKEKGVDEVYHILSAYVYEVYFREIQFYSRLQLFFLLSVSSFFFGKLRNNCHFVLGLKLVSRSNSSVLLTQSSLVSSLVGVNICYRISLFNLYNSDMFFPVPLCLLETRIAKKQHWGWGKNLQVCKFFIKIESKIYD